MAAPLPLRSDVTAMDLHRHARQTRNANQARRLLAPAAICDGGTRGDAARIGGVGLQFVRDWVVRFNAQGPSGLIDRKAPGPTPRLDEAQRRALAEAVENGPMPAMHGVVRWRLIDLAKGVREEFRITIGPETISRKLRPPGYRKLTARPHHHARKPNTLETFKKTSPPRWRDRVGRSQAQAHRAVVPGRGQSESKEWHHTSLGTTG